MMRLLVIVCACLIFACSTAAKPADDTTKSATQTAIVDLSSIDDYAGVVSGKAYLSQAQDGVSIRLVLDVRGAAEAMMKANSYLTHERAVEEVAKMSANRRAFVFYHSTCDRIRAKNSSLIDEETIGAPAAMGSAIGSAVSPIVSYAACANDPHRHGSDPCRLMHLSTLLSGKLVLAVSDLPMPGGFQVAACGTAPKQSL